MRSAEGDETAAAMALSTGLEAAMAADERSGTGVSLWLLEAAADSNDALYTADAGSASACCNDAIDSDVNSCEGCISSSSTISSSSK